MIVEAEWKVKKKTIRIGPLGAASFQSEAGTCARSAFDLKAVPGGFVAALLNTACGAVLG